MFLQNWKLALISIIMIPLASISAKTLGKRIGKVTTEAQEKSGYLTTYLVELFKNHKLMKIFQKENYETTKADKYLGELKDKNKLTKYNSINLDNMNDTFYIDGNFESEKYFLDLTNENGILIDINVFQD